MDAINTIIYINNEPYMNHTAGKNNGNYSCNSPGRQVLTDTWFSCVCYQLAFVLETIGFGYITAFLCTLIIIISIFGEIKENYKWFICNQAIWDLLVSYDLICNKPTNGLYFTFLDVEFKKKAWNQGLPTCIYMTTDLLDHAVFSWPLMFQRIAIGTLDNIQYSMTFSLAFSRFLAMFFPILYAKYTSKNKLFKLLISYNIFTLLVLNIPHVCDYFIKHQIIRDCYCATCNISIGPTCITIIQNQWWRYTINGMRYVATSLWLLFATIFTYAVFFKIMLHIKFQYQKNQKSLSSLLRISFALFFTAFVFSLYFLYVFTQELMANWIRTVLLTAGVDPKIANLLSMSTPSWLLHLKNTKQCLNNLRIFIECMLALIVLTGYREGLIKIANNVASYLFHPKKLLAAAKAKAGMDSSTVVLPYT